MSEIRCKKCRTTYTDIYGHPVNRCEDAPVLWWFLARHPRYNGREVWSPYDAIKPYSQIGRELQCQGANARLARLRDMEAMGLETTRSRGPNGRGLCCWCGIEVAPRRQRWCSDACVEQYKIQHDWAYLRGAVRERDKGVCATCGVDTERLHQILGKTLITTPEWFDRPMFRRNHRVSCWALEELGFTPCKSLWEADHIHARADGGTDHPNNLQTLCVPCHKARTRRQARARAEKRRQRGTLFEGVGK